MNIHDKAVHNMINNSGVTILSNSNMISNITRTCEICGRATGSLDNYICEECRNEIRRLFREYRDK